MRSRCRILPKADRDLDEETDYLAHEGGLEVGLSFLAAAQETFDLLAARPGMGWPCRLSHSVLQSVRAFHIKKFEKILVFYRPTSNGIEILRVLHSSQDLDAILTRE